MLLTCDQVTEFSRTGFLILDDIFSEEEAAQIRIFAQRDLETESPRRTLEAGSGLVRATHGAHQVEPFFGDLVRLPRVLEPVRQLLQDEVYVHQFKINAKAALGGELWEWHQDSFFWSREDGMPDAAAVNVAVHLDDVTEFNGPLLVVPGSHRYGEIPAVDTSAASTGSDWERTLSATLKYTMDVPSFTSLVETHGMASIKGKPGTVLLFHPSLVHGSAGNLTPFDRRLLIMSYNRCSNQLRPVPVPRPEFLASRDFTPLSPLEVGSFPAYVSTVADDVSGAGDMVGRAG